MPIQPIVGKLRKHFFIDVTCALGLGVSAGYAYWSVFRLFSCFRDAQPLSRYGVHLKAGKSTRGTHAPCILSLTFACFQSSARRTSTSSSRGRRSRPRSPHKQGIRRGKRVEGRLLLLHTCSPTPPVSLSHRLRGQHPQSISDSRFIQNLVHTTTEQSKVVTTKGIVS